VCILYVACPGEMFAYKERVVVPPRACICTDLKPVLTSISISSSNSLPHLAKVGDTIKVEVNASEAITAPNITISGLSATVTSEGDSTPANATYWKGVVSMTADCVDTEDVQFDVSSYQDLVGNAGDLQADTTDGSSVKFGELALIMGHLQPYCTVSNVVGQ
jgi:hypothetical protein